MKYSEDKFSELAQNHVQLFNELEARDVVFRYKLKNKRKLSPWMLPWREDFRQEEFDIYVQLDENRISETKAIEQITDLMELYYGKKYSLRD